jgi:hypothetical protein
MWGNSLLAQKKMETPIRKETMNENKVEHESVELSTPVELSDEISQESGGKKIEEKRTYTGVVKVNKDYDSSRKSIDSYRGKEVFLVVEIPDKEKGLELILSASSKVSVDQIKKMKNKKVEINCLYTSTPPNPFEQAPISGYTKDGKQILMPRVRCEVLSIQRAK